MSAILNIFSSVTSIKGMSAAMLWCHSTHLHSLEQQKFVKSQVETAWIMAEIKPYSFESLRNSLESEEDDVHKSQDEHWRGNKS